MKDCVNEEHEYSTRNDFLEGNETELHDELKEISMETKNEDILYRYITEDETEKIWIPMKT